MSARSYVLFCCDNGQVLLSDNMNTPMGMASTTKIMSALITLEYAQRDDKVVEFTSDMTAEGSSMYLKAGDKVRLSDLAAGMMTVSGNDAANAAAVAVAGSTEDFVQMMNNRAKEMGMKNTNFVNPSGLPDDNHYSTAYDMALLMSQALKNKSFAELSAKKSVQVDFVNPPAQRVTYTNHNKLLWRYEYCTGGKTGYTKSDGRCLVTCAVRGNLQLVAVTLNAPQDWADHTALYEYGFANFKAVLPFESCEIYSVRVASSDKESIRAVPECKEIIVLESADADRVKITVYMQPFAFAPVSKGQVLGKVVCTLDDEVINETDILASESAEYKGTSGILRFFRSLFR